jgi:hypothetical protein
MILTREQAAKLIKRRHPEWLEHERDWRFYLDSLEGGERYRHADYALLPFEPPRPPWYRSLPQGEEFRFARCGLRNLFPHLSELSEHGRDMYEMRLQRTPVPELVEFVVHRYLARIFAREVTRTGPSAVTAWWANVDGKGASIDDWMRSTIGPMLLALGQTDLQFARPEKPDDVDVRSLADLRRFSLDRSIAGFILAENVVWWRCLPDGSYAEVLLFERDPDDAGCIGRWRHWDAESSNCYTLGGEPVPDCSWDHNLGFVPLRRVFDTKKPRCTHVGKSRMGYAAQEQRSVYNRRSELELSDVMRTHPILQAPEDLLSDKGKATIGPGGMAPMKRCEGNGATVTYQGIEAVDMPQSGASECRQHILDAIDSILLHYGLMRPAGATGSTVAQSGVSKAFDQRDLYDLLAEVAAMLEACEMIAAEYACRVQGGSDADVASIDVRYPREYDLFSADQLAGVLADIQALAGSLGLLPDTEAEVLKRLITVLLPGLDSERMRELHSEIDDAAAAAATRKDQTDESPESDDAAAIVVDPAAEVVAGAPDLQAAV